MTDSVDGAYKPISIDFYVSKVEYHADQIVYYGEYHLLSLLTPSIVTTELLNRINFIRFNDKTNKLEVYLDNEWKSVTTEIRGFEEKLNREWASK